MVPVVVMGPPISLHDMLLWGGELVGRTYHWRRRGAE
jgi:hypothetical protein